MKMTSKNRPVSTMERRLSNIYISLGVVDDTNRVISQQNLLWMEKPKGERKRTFKINDKVK